MQQVAAGMLVALFLLFPMSAAIQGPATNSNRGSVEGSVVDSVTGQPLEGVQVALVLGQALPEAGVQSLLTDQKPTLEVPQVTKVIPGLVFNGRTMTPDRTAHSVLTDPRGKFTFTALAVGTYSLALRANGYNFQVYGQKPDSLASLPLDIREAKIDVGVIRMSPEPLVIGKLVDLDSRPVSQVSVYLLRAQPSISIDGQKEFRVEGEALTDGKGRYVFEKISAGRYYIVAGSFGRPELISFPVGAPDSARSGIRQPALQPYPFTYYPGVPDVGLAGQIDLPAGMKIMLGDMVMTNRGLSSIRGRVVDYATGQPPASVRVVLNAWFPFSRAGRDTTEIVSTGKYDRTTGTFEFTNLIPGRYRVDALLPRPQSSASQSLVATMRGVAPESAFQLLELTGADVSDLVLTVPGGGRITGKVVVADGKPLPVAERNLEIPLQLMFRPLVPLQPAPVVTAVSTTDGTFEVGSSLEGRYRFSVGPLRDNYYVSEAQQDGVRVASGILNFSKNTSELILTLSPGGQIQGAVVDKGGQPVKQAQGIIMPDPLPEVISFYQTLAADASGRFTVNGVPPGNHKIYVWQDIAPSQFFDRELLLRSRGLAFSVRVEKGSSVSASVPTIDR